MAPSGNISDVDARIRSQEITFDLNSAQPPINQYISKDDQLFIMSCNSIAQAITINVFARMLMPNGQLQQNQWTLTAIQQRAGFYQSIALPECFMVSCSVTCAAAFPGSLYIVGTIARGLATQGFQHLVLFKGYCTLNTPLSWPWGVNTTAVDCAGNIRSVTGTTPAAGSNISETVPANAKWRIVAIRFVLTTDATPLTRVVTLNFDDGSNMFASVASGQSQTASTTFTYTFGAGFAGSLSSATVVAVEIPAPLLLMPGFRLRTSSPSFAAGDQFSPPQYVVEEWLLP